MCSVKIKTVAAVLSAVMFMQCMTPAAVALAATNERRAVSQSIIGGAAGAPELETVSIDVANEDGGVSTITMVEDDLFRVVTVLDHQTGETNRIVYYKASGRLYSSYTGETVFVDIASTNVGTDTQALQTTYTTSWYSWSSIKAAVGTAKDASAILAGILALSGAGSADAAVFSIISAALSLVGGVIPDDKHHGLKVTVMTTVLRRVPYHARRKITGIEVY